jgi:hypothetical protein
LVAGKRLIYERDVIELRADTDIDALRTQIEDALNGKGSRWVEIPGVERSELILCSFGAQIRIEANGQRFVAETRSRETGAKVAGRAATPSP